jgi:hypothetical protein
MALLLAPATPGARAATSSAAASAAAWDHVPAAALRGPPPATPTVDPDRFAAFGLDQDALADVLQDAPAERRRAAAPAAGEGLAISIPTPAGDLQRFAIADSPIMEPALAAARPDIKTYTGRGIDDPTATVRLDLTPIGFHASVRSDAGAWYVDPRYRDLSQYVAYDRDALSADPYAGFVEGDGGGTAPALSARDERAGEGNGNAVTLRVYRLALVSDSTYATGAGGGDTTAAKVVLMNRVDQLYEQDFAIRMDLIAATPSLNLDTTAKSTGANGPCGAAACFTTLTCASAYARNNTVAGLLAGADTYDIAHVVLGSSGGGLAGVGVVGRSAKGQGCTALTTPTGDAFAVDYVAHEMGHQFGGEHTFNGTQTNCSAGNRATGATTVEPGSGSSVMAYAGICAQDDLQPHSDPYFSQASITQMSAYVSSPEASLSAQQQAALTGFDGTDSFKLTYGGNSSATITRGTNFDATSIKNAIQAIPGWPAGATVTVGGVADGGFTVTFGGTLALQPVGALGFQGLTGATGYLNDTIAGGTTRRGGSSVTTTPNHAPNVSAAGDAYTIPARTPFLLDATGSDPDGDPLTYLWEQNDRGTQTTAGGTALTTQPKTNGPLFRVFGAAARYSETAAHQSPSPGENAATATTWRSFPDLAQVAAGNTDAATGACPTGTLTDAIVDCLSELLPTADWIGVDGTRTMHFRVTARDDHPGFGGVGTADTALTVAPAAGPFRVTSQATPATVPSGTALPVTWNVAGTTGNGIDAANVRISLSVDGGQTFTRVLAATTPNDGAETVTVPRTPTTTGRIRVEAVGNVFYDLTRANLTITDPSPRIVNGPASASLGSAEVGQAAAPETITITSDGTAAATIGAVAIAGADGGAVAKTQDGCSSATLAAGASCTIALRLTPGHAGAQAATLTVPSDDTASPLTIALTGTGTPPPDGGGGGGTTTPATTPTPTPPALPRPGPTDLQRVTALAATLLRVKTPVLLGTAGHLRLFATTRSSKLGRPRPSRTIAAATCAGGTCRGRATAKLTLTSRTGRRTTRTITLVKVLKLADGRATRLVLRLSARDRRAIAAARRASLKLTVTNGRLTVTKTYTLTT